MQTGERHCLGCGRRVWTPELLHYPPSKHRPGCMVTHFLHKEECLTPEDLE